MMGRLLYSCTGWWTFTLGICSICTVRLRKLPMILTKRGHCTVMKWWRRGLWSLMILTLILMRTILVSMISILTKKSTKKPTLIHRKQGITITICTLIKIGMMTTRSSVLMKIRMKINIQMKERHISREITFRINNMLKLEVKKLTFLITTIYTSSITIQSLQINSRIL